MASITIKSTKNEILDALKEAQDEIKRLSSGKCNPTKEAAEEKVKEDVATANEAVSAGIFSPELTEKYTSLLNAIEAKQKELEELYGVEKNLMQLTAVVNAYYDEKAKIMNALTEQKKLVENMDMQSPWQKKNTTSQFRC